MRDHTNEDAARAEERWFRGIDDAPTPPSDAGTSERETGDEVQRIFCNAHGYDGPPPCPDCPAAPAAEGPREEPMLGFDALAQWSRRQSEKVNAPAAALPGAEAGTPDEGWQTARALRHLADELEGVNWSGGSCGQNTIEEAADLLEARCHRLAALTSEVRALTEQREMLAKRARQQITRLRYRLNDEDMSSGLRAGLIQQIEDWRDALAARLASPSPTGAPAEQQKN